MEVLLPSTQHEDVESSCPSSVLLFPMFHKQTLCPQLYSTPGRSGQPLGLVTVALQRDGHPAGSDTWNVHSGVVQRCVGQLPELQSSSFPCAWGHTDRHSSLSFMCAAVTDLQLAQEWAGDASSWYHSVIGPIGTHLDCGPGMQSCCCSSDLPLCSGLRRGFCLLPAGTLCHYQGQTQCRNFLRQ